MIPVSYYESQVVDALEHGDSLEDHHLPQVPSLDERVLLLATGELRGELNAQVLHHDHRLLRHLRPRRHHDRRHHRHCHDRRHCHGDRDCHPDDDGDRDGDADCGRRGGGDGAELPDLAAVGWLEEDGHVWLMSGEGEWTACGRSALTEAEWRFAVAVSSESAERLGTCVVQLSMWLEDQGTGDRTRKSVEMTLEQFYRFMAEMQKARRDLGRA